VFLLRKDNIDRLESINSVWNREGCPIPSEADEACREIVFEKKFVKPRIHAVRRREPDHERNREKDNPAHPEKH